MDGRAGWRSSMWSPEGWRRADKGDCTPKAHYSPSVRPITHAQHSMPASRRWSRSYLEPRTWTGQPGH